MRFAWICGLFSLISFTGCSALVNPDEGRLGELGGAPDAGPVVMLMDSGGPVVRDAGSPTTPPVEDTGVPMPPVDSGPEPECRAGEEFCEGDVWRFCDDSGVFRSQDCQSEGAYCDSGCQPWVCTPGTSECAFDFSAVVECDARGAMERRTECPIGCDPFTNTCVTGPTECASYPVIVPGVTQTFDLCSETNDHTFEPDDASCRSTSFVAESGERIYTFVMPRRGRVEIDLYDADSAVAIDTVVYLRSSCEDQTSQITCNDDIPCAESSVPGPGGCVGTTEVRQSIIETTLDAGTYYIVADAFRYSARGTTYSCGQVSLTVNLD